MPTPATAATRRDQPSRRGTGGPTPPDTCRRNLAPRSLQCSVFWHSLLHRPKMKYEGGTLIVGSVPTTDSPYEEEAELALPTLPTGTSKQKFLIVSSSTSCWQSGPCGGWATPAPFAGSPWGRDRWSYVAAARAGRCVNHAVPRGRSLDDLQRYVSTRMSWLRLERKRNVELLTEGIFHGEDDVRVDPLQRVADRVVAPSLGPFDELLEEAWTLRGRRVSWGRSSPPRRRRRQWIPHACWRLGWYRHRSEHRSWSRGLDTAAECESQQHSQRGHHNSEFAYLQ